MRNLIPKSCRPAALVAALLVACSALVVCVVLVTRDMAVAQPQPDCLYNFRVVGEAREYCATRMVMPPVPSHLCFLTPEDETVCLPLANVISRRSL